MAAIRPSFGLLAGLCLARLEGIGIRLTPASGRGINVVGASYMSTRKQKQTRKRMRVTYDNGDFFESAVNAKSRIGGKPGTEANIREYFIGKTGFINHATAKAVTVEFLAQG